MRSWQNRFCACESIGGGAAFLVALPREASTEDGKKRFRKSVSSTFFERLRSYSAKTLLKLNNNPAGFAGYFRVEKCGQTKAGEHKQVAHQA